MYTKAQSITKALMKNLKRKIKRSGNCPKMAKFEKEINCTRKGCDQEQPSLKLKKIINTPKHP